MAPSFRLVTWSPSSPASSNSCLFKDCPQAARTRPHPSRQKARPSCRGANRIGGPAGDDLRLHGPSALSDYEPGSDPSTTFTEIKAPDLIWTSSVKILKSPMPPWLARMATVYLVDFRNRFKITRESTQDEIDMVKTSAHGYVASCSGTWESDFVPSFVACSCAGNGRVTVKLRGAGAASLSCWIPD